MDKTTCQARGCGMAQEVIIKQDETGITAGFCRVHIDAYATKPDFTIISTTGDLAQCPRCHRVIGNHAQASHYNTQGIRCV